MTVRRSIFPVGVLCAALAGACPAVASADQVNASVRISDRAYEPPTVRIRAGEIVTWFNSGSRSHTVTSDSGTQLNSGAIGSQDEWTHRFTRPGVFTYHSEFLRDRMRGIVVVTGAPTPGIATVTVTVPASSAVTPSRVVPIPALVTIGDDIRQRFAQMSAENALRPSDSADWSTQALVFIAGAVTAVVVGWLLVIRRARRAA